MEDRGFEVTTKDWIARFELHYREQLAAYKEEKKKRVNLLKMDTIMSMLFDNFRFPDGPEVTEADVRGSNTDACIYVLSRQAGEGGDRKAEKGDFFLTDEEREAMNQHVVFTDRFLAAMSFDEHYKDVRSWAGKHHEHLNGTGYPKGLSGDEIPNEVRLLTIADIYDALVSDDRPYKKAHTKEAALKILFRMAEEGKLDLEILNRFQAALEWKERGFCL